MTLNSTGLFKDRNVMVSQERLVIRPLNKHVTGMPKLKVITVQYVFLSIVKGLSLRCTESKNSCAF